MHDIKLLVLLSVLKSVASLLSIKKRDNLQNSFANRFVDLGVVYIYIKKWTTYQEIISK